MITIFTDGSSRGNPGPGGWGSVIIGADRVIELGGAEKDTTNNRMELTAVISGLQKASESFSNSPNALAAIRIYTDSNYVINGITKWIHGWKHTGWKTKTKDDVMNKDLWISLDVALNDLGTKNVAWEYVGGHAGIAGNERCDEIATGFADGAQVKLYAGTFSGYPIPNILDISHDVAKLKAKKSSSSRSNAKAYSYVSSIGGEIETHRTWAECEKRVKGAKGARYKKSLDALDEAEIIDGFATL